MTGDRVTHKGSVWTSTADSNVWEPGVYGWTVDTEAKQTATQEPTK